MPRLDEPPPNKESRMPDFVSTVIWAIVAIVAILVFAEIVGKAL